MISIDDTIVAIATPLGEGGLGVVRLSGPRAVEIGGKLFSSKENLSQAPANSLHHGWILDPAGSKQEQNQSFVDESVAAVFRAPHSFTGEDVIEFSCHGSPGVLKKVVQLCEEAGARLARPGEFTQRAFLNGKMDLAQAEAVAEIIHSQSERARVAAVGHLRGQLSLRVQSIRTQLIDLLAHIEANLDFGEEEIPIIAREKITTNLHNVAMELEELLSTSVKGRHLRNGMRVVMAGRPNVGKSSLFNALLAQDRAIVTNIPGTTRDTLEEKLEWDGFSIVLVDTAGIRSTSNEVEYLGAARASRAQQEADVVVLVLDASVPLEEEDRVLLRRFENKCLVVLNKIDQSIKIEWPGAIAVSAKFGQGLVGIKAGVLEKIQGTNRENESAIVVTNMRHVELLEKAREKIAGAQAAAANGEWEEAVALDIRGALEELAAITGEEVSEPVLSAIFSKFCIGK